MLAVMLLLAACGGKALRWEQRVHVVRAGDTLQAIAFRYRVDARELAAWNRIDNPDLLFPGQTLRLSAPPGYRRPVSAATSAAPRSGSSAPRDPPAASAPPLAWVWPANGPLIARFGDATSLGQGVDIGGNAGDYVLAAAAGTVVYSGSGLLGYGKLIILKHNEVYLSAYGHNDALLVGEGDIVTAGQRIGKMGFGPGERAALHFEIRIKGKPVDPLQFLPSREAE
ncbi:MAG: peptidoglycan DD-metalloendopeptidase family protein [Gammaproteobacteria bacterium]|nr:peptidoglycan DD-metalloendopeptidase family protein [Gammaproteobacteria bacterium]NNF59811.1 peptidoglycan DD-metalloendopeptidase family protein [Gammaproteobacteria bacterium]NNM21315.1 peptidoglycan DD-metalloendopeptidase family protein [Gammaproteobacteria bacterium]